MHNFPWSNAVCIILTDNWKFKQFSKLRTQRVRKKSVCACLQNSQSWHNMLYMTKYIKLYIFFVKLSTSSMFSGMLYWHEQYDWMALHIMAAAVPIPSTISQSINQISSLPSHSPSHDALLQKSDEMWNQNAALMRHLQAPWLLGVGSLGTPIEPGPRRSQVGGHGHRGESLAGLHHASAYPPNAALSGYS